MKSYRIYQIGSDTSIDDIFINIKNHPYNNDSGFSLIKKRSEFIECVHIYKKSQEKNIKLPTGELELITYVDYINTKFKVIEKNRKCFIILIDPPKEISKFNFDVLKIIPMFSSISLMKSNPDNFISYLRDSGLKIEIKKIELSDINVENKGIAKINFSSEKDIYTEAIHFIGNKKFTTTSAQLLINESEGDMSFLCQIGSNGTIRVNSENETVINHYFNFIS
jgi:hypothetical protein